MLKFLHTADIHLDSPLRSLALRDRELQSHVHVATRAVLRKIVNLAIEEKVAALLLAGDVFDNARRSARSLAFLRAQLERLKTANIPVFYIKGNHDAENSLTDIMDWPDNVTIFSGRGETFPLGQKALDGRAVYVHGVSFAKRQAPNLLDKFPAPVANAVNIGLLHTSLNGAAGHDVYAPCTVDELMAKGYDYWALGHIHKRQVYHEQNPLIVMPGAPQGRDIGEEGDKSVSLVRLTADGTWQEEAKILADTAFYRCAVALDGVEETSAVHDKITAALQELRRTVKTHDAIVRLSLQGATKLHWQIALDEDYWQKSAVETAADIGGLWIEKLDLQLTGETSNQSDSSAENALPAAELTALMQKAADTPELQQDSLKNINKLLSFLPPEARKLWPDMKPEELAARFLPAGAENIAALLSAYGQSGEQAEEENE
ncbi:MAG: DNA repair exonuclease [Candidatus Tokpelaia sp.]|nr:MAG: DNA repair exonuclease [Candidatus Tokpelaia sp.]KAA6207616.1 MAG: DNA repair exonuclease [Candidatus Tokpelaia sp.]